MGSEAIHERIEAVLGWQSGASRGFSLQALRDLVRTAPRTKRTVEIVADIDRAIRTGEIVTWQR